jgi:lipoyl(octanoyl) transferase
MQLRGLQRSPTLAPGRAIHTRSSPTNLILYDLHEDVMPYEVAWEWQKERAQAVAEGREDQAVLLLQHSPTYTLGTGSSLENLKFDLENPPYPLFRTERGGEVTYHGPGQLVMYPIIDLRHHEKDLHLYLRKLESVIIMALEEVSGVKSFRSEGLTGSQPSSFSKNTQLCLAALRL